jgi:hypothetical protein
VPHSLFSPHPDLPPQGGKGPKSQAQDLKTHFSLKLGLLLFFPLLCERARIGVRTRRRRKEAKGDLWLPSVCRIRRCQPGQDLCRHALSPVSGLRYVLQHIRDVP